MKNILVTIDVDDKNALLIGNAIKLAQAFGSKVWILHVTAPEPDFVGYRVGPQYIRNIRAEEIREEHKIIQKYSNQLKHLGIEADGLLMQGATSEMILNEIVALNINLLIIGRHTHGFFDRIFGNSIVPTIIEKSSVPILLVPLDHVD